jgi:hypothetical protein
MMLVDSQAAEYLGAAAQEDDSSDFEFECEYCGATYASKSGLAKHEKKCKPAPACKPEKKSKPSPASKPEKKSKPAPASKPEKKCKPAPASKPTYPCIDCGLPYNTKGGLTIHRRTCSDALASRNTKQLLGALRL